MKKQYRILVESLAQVDSKDGCDAEREINKAVNELWTVESTSAVGTEGQPQLVIVLSKMTV